MTVQSPDLLNRLAAQCDSLTVSSSTHWLQLVQAVGAIATTIGVLTALYVVVVRDPREASKEQKHHNEQIDAIQRADMERASAQARKLVPSCVRTPIFGDLWWTVRIDNTSHQLVTILAVEVAALDAVGVEIHGGSKRTSSTTPEDQVIDRSMRAVLSAHPDSEVIPTLGQAVRDAMTGHFVDRWPRKLSPYQHALMTYVTAEPDYTLQVTVDYEDEAGYQWRRTDTGQPRRTDGVQFGGPTKARQPW